MTDFLASIEADLVALRRELHANPEVGLHLPWTQARVLKALAGLPLEITLGEQLSSIVAVLRGRGASEGERRTVLLRGDMDGLPLVEATGVEFASTNGAMHACGHDLHMTMLVGAARALCERAEELPGDVVFMFQPGEEGMDGASYMLTEGVLDASGRRVDAAYAIHVWAAGDEPSGTFTTKTGTVMAAAEVASVTILGRGGHGSAPHNAADPVPAMAEMILATQTMVGRQYSIFDPVVVTVGKAVAGTAPNIIPESAHFEATIRTFSETNRLKIRDTLKRLFEGIASAHGLTSTFEIIQSYPVTVNHVAETEFVTEAVTELFGADRHIRWDDPLAGAEDFSRVIAEVPGSFIGLNACMPDLDPATAPANHSAYAQFDDRWLVDGARLLTELAVRTLGA